MAWNWIASSGDGKIQSTGSAISGLPVSVAAWYKHEGGTQSDECIFQIEQAGSGTHKLTFGVDDATSDVLRVARIWNDSFSRAVTSATITDSVWQHYIGTVTADDRSDVWLNNGSTGSDATSHNSATGMDQMTIGREGDQSDDDSWEGSLAELGVWNIGIDATHRAILAAGFSPLHLWDILPNLVVYEPMLGPNLNRYLLHASAKTFTAGTDGTETPAYTQDHPPMIYPSAQILQFPPPAAAASGVFDIFNAGIIASDM